MVKEMKILIVDDEPLVRRSLQRAFQAAGHEVFVAEEGISGLQLWELQKPQIIFLDVLMPGMTGPQVIDKANPELKSRTKIIVMSAFAGEFNHQLKENQNFDLYLAKPFDDILQIVKIAEDLLRV